MRHTVGGSFRLTFGDATTAPIRHDAAASGSKSVSQRLQALGGVTEGETQSNAKHGLTLLWLPQKTGERAHERLLFVQIRQALSLDAIKAMAAGCQQRNRQV